MYLDYIESKAPDVTEDEKRAAEHIDILTYNRIDYDKLTDFQRKTIDRVHSRLAAFEKENKELLESYLNNYAINGVSMEFGNSWNLKVIGGVAIPTDIYQILLSTGLCYPAI